MHSQCDLLPAQLSTSPASGSLQPEILAINAGRVDDCNRASGGGEWQRVDKCDYVSTDLP